MTSIKEIAFIIKQSQMFPQLMFANNLPKLWSSCLNIPYGDLNIIFIIITITITVILSLCHLL